MACCIFIIAVISSWWGFRRKVRKFLGLPPDDDWDEDDEPVTWLDSLRDLGRSKVIRMGAVLMSVGLTFLFITLFVSDAALNLYFSNIRSAASNWREMF